MTIQTYLQSLNDIIRGSEPTPRCRWCGGTRTRDSGRACSHCDDMHNEPLLTDEDEEMEP